MKWSTTASLALAAAGVLALAALALRERGRTAEEYLASIQKRYAAGDLGRDQLLRELSLAEDQAEHEGQHELALRVQLERGRVLLDLGSFASARTELAAVAAGVSAPRELQLLRIELERRAGEPAAGLELAGTWLAAHPDDAGALELAGHLERMRSEAARDEALELCQKELLVAVAKRAAECVRELSARPAGDLRRVALARDLRALFGARREASAERVLVLCDQGASAAAAGRADYGRSLELSFAPTALGSLAEMCTRAGLGEEALDLLTAASKRPELLEDESAQTGLLRALAERERWTYAAQVARTWLQHHKASLPFLIDACRATHSWLEQPDSQPIWLLDQGAALSGVASSELAQQPWFYIGEAQFRLGGPDRLALARHDLDFFVVSASPEPFPGARAMALRHLAECCRTLGLPAEERAALESAVELDPRNGEISLRLAELQLASERGGFRAPDLRWARGMALLPKRQAELYPRWLEIGASELRALGLDPRGVEQDVRNGLNVHPSAGAAPFELYTLVHAYLAANRLYEAQVLLQTLELAVPDFLPAIDLRIELLRARGQTRELVQAMLARLKITGFDARTRELRAALPADAFSPTDLRRAVRADPEGSGRMALARSLAARGEPHEALHALLEVPPEQRGSAEQVFAARLELETGAADAAFERLGGLGDELLKAPGALEVWIDAGLRGGRTPELGEKLPARILALGLERERLLALADRLLGAGEAALARGILQRLDQAGKPFRGGDLYWRLAACALALETPEASARRLERAAAFETHGEVELLELLALPADAGSESARAAVQAVRKAGWSSTPLGKAALALLADEPAALRTALDAARGASAQDPLLALFDATALAPGAQGEDARFLAAVGQRGFAELVLALERPALGGFACARLKALGDSAGSTWPAWFRARLHRQAGERESEERVLRALLEKDPHFGAAWDRLLEMHGSVADEGEQDLDLRLARFAALGESSGSPAERDWDRSRKLEREGALVEALLAARAAAAAAPDSGPILHHLGRLALRMERLSLALGAYRRALPLLPPSSGARSTAEFLDLLELARAADPPLLDAQAERTELELLAARAPEDPRVLLAQARNDLETSAPDPSFGAARAAQRLEQFRARHAGRSFEALAPGSTEAWAGFLLELDPARAREFLEAELDRDPGNLQAWLLLPRCNAADGREEEALSDVAFLERLAPGKVGLAEYMRVRAHGDWKPKDIAQISERLQHLDPGAERSPAEIASELRAYLSLGPSGVPSVLELGAALTPARLAAQPVALRAEVYWVQAIALLARDNGDDRAQARLRTAVLDTLVRDPARRPLLAALRGLSRPAKSAP